jgi:hypothetical protein
MEERRPTEMPRSCVRGVARAKPQAPYHFFHHQTKRTEATESAARPMIIQKVKGCSRPGNLATNGSKG